VSIIQCGLNVFPVCITSLELLTTLDLSNNKIDTVPKQISLLTNLKHLFLVENNLKKLPKQISKLTNLETLALTGNQLSSVPKEIYSMVNLEVLWLSYNPIQSLPGTLFKSLRKLKKFSCGFSLINSIPREIKFCQNLEKLVIKCNRIRCLPIELKSIPNLKTVEFNDNPVMTKMSLSPVNFPIEQDMKKIEEKYNENKKDLDQKVEALQQPYTSVPSLFELCARYIKRIKEEDMDSVPQYIRERMKSFKRCTECKGPYFEHSYSVLTFEKVSEEDDTISSFVHNICSLNCLIALKEKYEELYYLPPQEN